jgi:hypothetical protein
MLFAGVKLKLINTGVKEEDASVGNENAKIIQKQQGKGFGVK